MPAAHPAPRLSLQPPPGSRSGPAPHQLSPHAVSDAAAAPLMVPLVDLLTANFLRRHTGFASAESFFTAGQFCPRDLVHLQPLPRERLDRFVRSVSGCHNWDALVRLAGAEWTIRRLGIFIDA